MQTLNEKQWAKIHGHNAGKQGSPASYNPYIKGFNDSTGELGAIWATARNCAISNIEYYLPKE